MAKSSLRGTGVMFQVPGKKSIFSYSDWGRGGNYFPHLNPVWPVSNIFFNTLVVQIYKHFIRTILSDSQLRSVVCHWQSLLTGEKSSKAAALSLVVHRLNGSKETIKLLHCSGAGISNDDVSKQIKSFSAEVQNNLNSAPETYQIDSQINSK